MKKLIGLLLLFVHFFGNEGSALIDQVQEEFISYATKKYKLTCTGTGASFPKKIESMFVLFEQDKILSIDDSRILIINLVNDFQKIINQNEKIKSFLADVPYPADRINVALFQNDGKNLPPPDVFSNISTARGDIIFATFDLEKSIFDETKIREPLEESCKKTGISIPLIRSSYSDYEKNINTPSKSKPKP